MSWQASRAEEAVELFAAGFIKADEEYAVLTHRSAVPAVGA